MNPQFLTLDNGLKLIFEHTPNRKSVDIILYVNVGSRDEKEDEHGITHLLEHLLFKSNHKKSRNIHLEIDRLGGEVDAFTTREGTYFTLKLLRSHFVRGINLLSEIIQNPDFTEKDLTLEKEVVKEEIRMYKDSPEEIVLDLFLKSSLNGHPLAREILGTEKTVESITIERLLDYFYKNYTPDNMIIAISGDLSLKKVSSILERVFINRKIDIEKVEENPKFNPNKTVVEEKFEQVHILYGTEGYNPKDVKKFSLYLLSIILGGGLSSRLFQELREKKGLVYNVESQGINFKDISIFSVYTATSERFLEETLFSLKKELDKIKSNGISKEELDIAKRQSIYNFLMSMESPKYRLYYYLDSILIYDKIIPFIDTIKNIRRVKLIDVLDTVESIFYRPFSLTIVGPVNKRLKNIIERGEIL
ncbi:MAG: peptidase M16 [Dictyoglomus sp. NZ13-RE01]|nr:MAG: peptidase M16 [Dictyoglomus sp. NZ13-RE01]